MFNKGFIKKYISSGIEEGYSFIINQLPIPIALLIKSFSIKYRRNRLLLESFIELPIKDFIIYQLVNNWPKIKLFLQKISLSAGGSFPRPHASGGWGFAPRTPGSGRWGTRPKPPIVSWDWGLRPQTPVTAHTLQISGYAPGTNTQS